MGHQLFCNHLPGLIIQILLIPAIMVALMRARLIPRRYPLNVEKHPDEV